MPDPAAEPVERARAWAEALAAPARGLWKAAAGVLSPTPVGYYLHAARPRLAAVHCPGASARWEAIAKQACRECGAAAAVRLPDAGPPRDEPWVKAAYSAGLRRALEYANFFPGQYPFGVPNHATPLAALLTSALLGAGLGWGGGRLLASALPAGYGGRLGRTGLLLGGLAGAGLGATPGLANLAGGRTFNDPLPFGSAPDEPPDYGPEPGEAATGEGLGSRLPKPWAEAPEPPPGFRLKRGRYEGYEAGDALPPGASPGDVYLPRVERALDDAGAGPNFRSGVLGPLYAARLQWTDAPADGWVRGDQLGRLAAKAGTDYLRGLAVGAAVNHVVGSPHSARAYGVASMAAGLLGMVVPRLFG